MQRLHAADSGMLAHPWAQRYRQSKQGAIEMLAMALEPGATTRHRARAWLQFKGARHAAPGRDGTPGARLTAVKIGFDEHPKDERCSDRIETVTADPVFEWLGRAALAGRLQAVRE